MAASVCVGNNYAANITKLHLVFIWRVLCGCHCLTQIYIVNVKNDLLYGESTVLFLSCLLKKMKHKDIRQHSHSHMVLITEDYLFLCLLLLQTRNFSFCGIWMYLHSKIFSIYILLTYILSWILHIKYVIIIFTFFATVLNYTTIINALYFH